MSYEEMQKLEDVEGFFESVNRGKDLSEAEAAEKVYNDHVATKEKEQKKEKLTMPMKDALIADNRPSRRSRIRAFWRQVMEPAFGYIALGGVMVAGMVLNMVPAYVAIPVFSLSFIWAAIRADRFLREV